MREDGWLNLSVVPMINQTVWEDLRRRDETFA